jgi:hypothetical protein
LSRAAFADGHAAELAALNHERGIEQAATLQVLDYAGDGHIGLGTARIVILANAAMREMNA